MNHICGSPRSTWTYYALIGNLPATFKQEELAAATPTQLSTKSLLSCLIAPAKPVVLLLRLGKGPTIGLDSWI